MALSPIVRTAGTTTKTGIARFFAFSWRYWYTILVILSLIPTIVSSIQVSYQTKNPFHPFAEVGLTIFNADASIDKDVDLLRQDKEKFLGIKPDEGLWNKTKYNFSFLLIIWRFLGKIILITFPFVYLYKFLKWRGRQGYETSSGTTLVRTLIFGFIALFIFNLIYTIILLLKGTLLINLPETTIQKQILFVIIKMIPLHGMVNLITYLIGIKMFYLNLGMREIIRSYIPYLKI